MLITAGDLLPLIKRLDAKYRKRMADPDLMNEAKELAHFCRWHDRSTIEQAIDLVIKREPHFPTPQKVLDAISEVREKELTKQTRVSRDPDVCRLCNTKHQGRTRLRRKDPAHADGNYVAVYRLYCDHGWRRILWYSRDDELALMHEDNPEDSIVAGEIRKRAGKELPDRPSLFSSIASQVGQSMPAAADHKQQMEANREGFNKLVVEQT